MEDIFKTQPNLTPSPKPIRVLVVDDQALVRTGLTYFLMAFDDLELVGEAKNGEQAAQMCAQLQPDVVLMDLVMTGMNGAAATRIICSHWPHIRVIVLTNYLDTELVQEALQAGAFGYLLKGVSADELAAAIRSAYQGRPTLAPEATLALIQATAHPTGPNYDLTPREHEVLALMVEGLGNTEIAHRLTIGLSTVKYHVSSILAKMGVTSRAEAVALAWKHHLVSKPGEKPHL